MKVEDPDRKLDRLRSAAQRISANLVELEVDSGRELLEATTLRGESAARWSRASATLTELWREAGLLEGLLNRAGKVRGSRRRDELSSLLEGPSIELASSDVPLAERELLASSLLVQRCTPDELIARMSSSFDEVKAVVAGITGAWETLIPRLDTARRLLGEAQGLAEEIGEPTGADFASASDTLDALRASVTADPLSVSSDDISRLVHTAESMRDDLQSGAALMRSFDTQVLAARELLEQIGATIAEGHAAREELVAKISMPAGLPAPDANDELGRRLNEIATLAGTGTWREARRAIADWNDDADSALSEARRALEANRAPIAARNQFRALLEAYQVKAKRLGRLEEPEVADIHARAQEALYTAPTDLAAVAQLVRSYQQALAGSTAGSEVKR